MPPCPKHTRRWFTFSLTAIVIGAVTAAIWLISSRRAGEIDPERLTPVPQGVAVAPLEPSPDNALATDEERAIIHDLLEQVVVPIANAGRLPKGIILLRALSAYSDSWKVKALLDGPTSGANQEIVQRFIEANAVPKRWPDDLHLSNPYRLIEGSVWQLGGWDIIRKEVPRACVEVAVSRPGFSTDRKTAWVYFDHDGGGGMAVMRKREGSWVIEDFLAGHVY
jgi:hypothetical protein